MLATILVFGRHFEFETKIQRCRIAYFEKKALVNKNPVRKVWLALSLVFLGNWPVYIRRFITTKTAILLVNSFVISRVDYCNSLLVGLPNCHLHRIQLVLNVAARLLYRGQKKDHITPLLRDKLHWLPIAARIQFKIRLLTYKSLHGLVPQYLADFLKPVASVLRRSTLRSASNESLIIPATKTVFGTRLFSVAGPTYWNQLPETVKNASSVNTFKRHLKTYLFKLSYFS